MIILKSSNNNVNTSYIYANIVPINSSRILLGNEFNLNYKSSYDNQMKTLINSIHLISNNYINLKNVTMNKFGVEYSYIAMAMNNMLKDTNKNIKNMEINKTEGIVIDYSFMCIYSILVTMGSVLGMVISVAAAISSFGSVTPLAAWEFYFSLISFGLSMAGIAATCR